MPLTPSMLLELGAATAWTFYYILEAGVKLFIPSKMFHKVSTTNIYIQRQLMISLKIILVNQEKVNGKINNFQDITGQIVLVTGGGSGIGRLMCLKSVLSS